MAAAQPVKFAFGALFEAPAGDGRAARDIVDRRQLEAAKAEAYAVGVKDGVAEESRSIARRDAEAMAAIGEALTSVASQAAEAHAAAGRHGAHLALQIARKLAVELTARAEGAELEALVRRGLGTLMGEPRVVVRLSPAMFDLLGARLDGLAIATGFAGQVVLVGDQALADGDCRVEWADGGIVRDEAAVWREIEEMADRVVGPRPAAPASIPAPEPAAANAAEQETS